MTPTTISDEQVVSANTEDPKCHQEVAAIHAAYQGAMDHCQPHRAQDHLLLYHQPQGTVIN